MAKEKQNNTSTNVSYQGNVKIQYAKGKKIYKTVHAKNKGTAELFRYIANCIAGNYNQSLMPKYVHLFSTSIPGGTELWSTSKSTCALNIPYSSVQVRKATNAGDDKYSGYVAEFTFMISYDQISADSDVICLYNVSQFGDLVTPLAYLVLPEYEKIVYNKTSNVIITWQLLVSNAAVE